MLSPMSLDSAARGMVLREMRGRVFEPHETPRAARVRTHLGYLSRKSLACSPRTMHDESGVYPSLRNSRFSGTCVSRLARSIRPPARHSLATRQNPTTKFCNTRSVTMPPSTSATIAPELKTALDALRAGIDAAAPASKLIALQTQVDAIDRMLATKHFGDSSFGTPSTLLKTIQENESISRLLKDRRGTAVLHLKGNEYTELMNRKSIISGVTSGSAGGDTLNPVGTATSGVLQIDRIPGITPEARQVLKVRNVLSARPTTLSVVDYVKVTSPMAIASPVPEASVKPENSVTFSSLSEKVRLIATWIPATKQVLDDFTELLGFIQSTLPFYVDLEEELQLLAGDNTGENLHGLLSQAAAFNAGLLPSAAKGWTKIDVVATAIRQINDAKEIDPSFVIMNTNDWWDIALTKDSLGRYILGEPGSLTTPRVFGLDVVSTTSIAQGTFLVGSGSQVAAEIRDRQEMQVEISTEHSDYFVRNLVAVRAEKRLALITKRANSFVTGTFTTSP
jgi:HK97 family phage major capsid protein